MDSAHLTVSCTTDDKMEASKEYQEIVNIIRKKFGSSRRYTVAVDGADHAGKTTIARYLSWQLRMSIFELDIYVNPDNAPTEKDIDILKGYISFRHKANIPVVVEGICVLEILEKVKIKPDFYIVIKNSSFKNGTGYFREKLLKYNEQYSSQCIPDYELQWSSK